MHPVSECLIVCILLLLIYKLVRSENLDNPDYLGSGITNAVYTSGATMRRLGQKFSSTNQGEYTTLHNAEIKDQSLRELSAVPVVIFPAKSIPPELVAQMPTSQ
jgi:hypothetical protein